MRLGTAQQVFDAYVNHFGFMPLFTHGSKIRDGHDGKCWHGWEIRAICIKEPEIAAKFVQYLTKFRVDVFQTSQNRPLVTIHTGKPIYTGRPVDKTYSKDDTYEASANNFVLGDNDDDEIDDEEGDVVISLEGLHALFLPFVKEYEGMNKL
jgi:hypothetical protein